MKFKNTKMANKGMEFERILTNMNSIYKAHGEACIVKIPTSWKVLWKNRNGYRVPINAFPEEKAFLDYMGVVKCLSDSRGPNGTPVSFDAKETSSKTSFALSNITEGQYDCMEKYHNAGGITFIIVRWTEYGEYYLVSYEKIMQYKDNSKTGGRKSIPYSCFKESNGFYKIEVSHLFEVDWLNAYKEYANDYYGITTLRSDF